MYHVICVGISTHCQHVLWRLRFIDNRIVAWSIILLIIPDCNILNEFVWRVINVWQARDAYPVNKTGLASLGIYAITADFLLP